MKLIEFNWKPTDRQLRQFGLAAAVVFTLLGWAWSAAPAALVGLIATGLLSALIGWLQPRLLRIPFLALSLITFPIGMVVSELVMLVCFFVVLLPIGLFFRLIGRDALDRRIDRTANSYWRSKAQPKDSASYFFQS